MNTIRRDLVEVAMEACRGGHRVTLDNFRAQAGATPRASVQNSNRAIAENRAGRFSLTVFGTNGTEPLHAGVNRDDAQKLVAAGAEFIGQPWRAP
jgi:hypothetical protein